MTVSFETKTVRIETPYSMDKVATELFFMVSAEEANPAVPEGWHKIKEETKVQGQRCLSLGMIEKQRRGISLSSRPELAAKWDKFQAERSADIASQREENLQGILSGEKKIVLTHHFGDILSGHMCHNDIAENLLEDLGMVRHVTGWGSVVDAELVKALGEEFTYSQAVEYCRPDREKVEAEKAEAEKAKREKYEAALAVAKETGKPQKLSTQMIPECMNGGHECSADLEIIEVLPGGQTQTRYQCCH